jgi:hypothetical protein
VGTSGRKGERCGIATPSGRSLPAATWFLHARHRVRHRRNAAADDLRLRFAAPLEGNVVELDSRRGLEGLHREVARGAHAERAVGDLARLRLRRGDEFLERLVRLLRPTTIVCGVKPMLPIGSKSLIGS